MVTVVAHRGAAGIEPENTLRGFHRAIELGAEWTECDVHLTADARLVVIHDETVDRTTDGAGAVGEMTFDQIRRLDAGEGERVPMLEEVLDTVRGRIRLQVELKGEGTPRPAVETVRAMGMADAVLFTSFQLERLRRVREIEASLEVAVLFAEPGPEALDEARGAGARSLHVFYKNLTWALVEEAHAAGLLVGAWNPDSEPEWRAMIALGADIIGSNRPDLLIEFLRRQ